MNNKILQQKINRRKSIIDNLPFDKEGCTFNNPSMTVEQGMAKATRLAMKGIESNNLNLWQLRRGGK